MECVRWWRKGRWIARPGTYDAAYSSSLNGPCDASGVLGRGSWDGFSHNFDVSILYHVNNVRNTR